jgi:AcrR family transcriptional regulator
VNTVHIAHHAGRCEHCQYLEADVIDSYHHGALAEAMVEQATAEVRERGSESVSLRRIAGTLGVSPSAAYNHFPDKDGLLHEVGERGHVELDRRMGLAVAKHRAKTNAGAVARFRALGEAYFSFAVDEPNLFLLTFGRMCFNAGAEKEESGPYARLAGSLDELQARGLLRAGIRPNLDLTVWAAVHGMCVLILEGGVPAAASNVLLDSLNQLVLAPTP